MPRASDGTHSLPSGTLVNTGDTVLVSQHNPAMQDLSQSLTNSLDRDGKGAMRADLAMGNNKITGLAPGEDDTDAATVGQLTAGVGVPIGAVIDFWGTVPPEGFLFPAGQEISRTTYSDLFAVIDTAGGAGDGSTTFNLPDYRGRIGAGKDNMGGPTAGRLSTLSSTTLGAVGGAQTVTLTTAEMPAHGHTGTTDASTAAASAGVETVSDGFATVTEAASGSHSHTFTTGNTGGGGAHSNVQPTIIANKIMRVL